MEAAGVTRAGALVKADPNANRCHPTHYLTTVGALWVGVNQRQLRPRTKVGVCQLRGNIRGGQENVGYTVPGRRKRASFPKHRCARNPIAAIWTSVNLTGLGFAKLSAA